MLLRQFIQFSLIGALNTVVLLTTYYVIVWVNKDWYIAGNAAGYCLAVLNSYLWNSKLVFKNKRRSGYSSFIKTAAVNVFIFLLQTALLYLMVDRIGLSEKIAPLINIAITTPLNFTLCKLWAFKDRSVTMEVSNERSIE
jgi:putative flippase GtrA